MLSKAISIIQNLSTVVIALHDINVFLHALIAQHKPS